MGEKIVNSFAFPSDPRLSLNEGFNLEISGLREDDAGEYVCEIETYGAPLDQNSKLEILGKSINQTSILHVALMQNDIISKTFLLMSGKHTRYLKMENNYSDYFPDPYNWLNLRN